MLRLCSLVVLAFLSLAFAPAPFPKNKARVKDSLAVKDLLGTWRITALYHLPDTTRKDPAANGVTTVTISPTQWVFNKAANPVIYDLRLHHEKRPAEIDFMHVGQMQPYGRGLIRREGDMLRVVYSWSSGRPTGFENQQGGCIITLVRESAAY
jgi:uncharacterized protein (TIGR03067 family)